MTRDEAFAVLKELDEGGIKTALEPHVALGEEPGDDYHLKVNLDSLKGVAFIERLATIARTNGTPIIGEFGALYLR